MRGHVRTHFVRVAVALALSGAGLTLAAAEPAAAVDSFTVNTTNDTLDGACNTSPDCSIRDAFAAANASSSSAEIFLQANETYDLILCTEGDLDHTADHDLLLDGNDATIRQTCAGERVLEHDSTGSGMVDVTIQDVTVTGGTPNLAAGSSGGGISAADGDLTVDHSVITGNAANPGGGSGGGIDSLGPDLVSIVDSTITDNTAGDSGGGLRSFGDIAITRSTVAGNESAGNGGGIDAGQAPSLLAVNSTVTGNRGSHGGGITAADDTQLTSLTVAGNRGNGGANLRSFSGDMVELTNTVIAGGKGSNDCGGSGSIMSSGHNADGDGSCALAGPGDQSTIGDPSLGPLAPSDAVLVRVPLAGSPLIDAVPVVDCGILTPTDQRGVTKPTGSFCDIGAVEVGGADLQADGLVRRSNEGFGGLGVFNDTGARQTARARRQPGRTAHYVVQARNAAPLADDELTVTADPGTNRFRVHYEHDGTDVTADVTAGIYTTASSPAGTGEDIDVFVKVRAGTPADRKLKLAVTIVDASAAHPDTVKMKTTST